MKNTLQIVIAAAIFLFSHACTDSGNASRKQMQPAENTSQTEKRIPEDFIALQKAYPDFIADFDSGQIIWTDGSRMLRDDGLEKNFDSLLNHADIQDQFAFSYPADFEIPPKKGEDPGRIRNDEFFKKMYGSDASEVEANLTKVKWPPFSENNNLKFSEINGAADSLRAVAAEIENRPHLHKYINQPAGTFYWRFISGTQRLSMHSFAVALDINIDYFNYWKWDIQQGKELNYKNRVPEELVKIFEKHGFIWGGKWHHYDTGHFEFRPEFFLINR